MDNGQLKARDLWIAIALNLLFGNIVLIFFYPFQTRLGSLGPIMASFSVAAILGLSFQRWILFLVDRRWIHFILSLAMAYFIPVLGSTFFGAFSGIADFKSLSEILKGAAVGPLFVGIYLGLLWFLWLPFGILNFFLLKK